ncbi:MAG: peptidoglycan-binding protein [Candidatus Taylorbacteria bacterium]|nr:peptidoglycan-binding protein [Candidatus Taylorbacteria bacterium]
MKKAIIVLALSAAFTASVQAACVDIATDLGPRSEGASVTSLQNLLKDSGYLSATPNGYFGPATEAAVKKFQSANGISPTGFVGPSTRAKIKSSTCSASQAGQAPQGSSSKPYGVTSPRAGEALSIGKSHKVSWATEIKSDYSIILEDDKGVAQGFITSNQVGGKSFTWKVGKLSTASGDKNALPGTYRIRIQKTSSGATADDETSGYFTIAAQGLTVSSILPSTVAPDSNSVVVLYGSGFTASTFVYLDGIRNIQTSRLFVSPDGKVIVFALPEGVSSGAHYISLKNGYESVENAGRIRVEERD